MSQPHIERSDQRSVFTAAGLRNKVNESKAYWSSPAGKRKAAQFEVEKRNRKHVPAKFPDLAKRQTTGSTDSVAYWKKRLALLNK